MNAEKPTQSVEAHWDTVYRTKEDAQLSWHQDVPRMSLELIDAYAKPGDRIIDVGGGCSALAGMLAAQGFERVTVLDVAPAAIARAKRRCGEASGRIHWIVGDVTAIADLDPVDIWHDRAVFHFLTDAMQRERYASALRRTLRVGGHAVIATFAPDGPELCSGLPVMRYDADGLCRALDSGFALVRAEREQHITPWGKPQSFSYAVLRRDDTITHAHDAVHDEIRPD